ncbi:MAG: DUF11 domain-containing protein [Saprospirales bacterium]|nr:DUF11 domain-containing protein [Saprospirales bacterium]
MSNTTPNVGDEVTFTLTITNAGPDAATGVAAQDFVPAGFSAINTISNSGVESPAGTIN